MKQNPFVFKMDWMASLKYLPGGGNGEPGRNLLSLLAFFFLSVFLLPEAEICIWRPRPLPDSLCKRLLLGPVFGGGVGVVVEITEKASSVTQALPTPWLLFPRGWFYQRQDPGQAFGSGLLALQKRYCLPEWWHLFSKRLQMSVLTVKRWR